MKQKNDQQDPGQGDSALENPSAPPAPGDDAGAQSPPPADTTDASGGGDDGGSADSSPKPPPPSPKPAAKADWKDKRIAQLTAQLAQARQSPKPVAAPEPPAGPDVVPASEVERRAMELAAIQDFNRRCDETQQAGRQAFGQEFDQRVGGIRQLVDPQNPSEVASYNQLLDAAIQTGNGPALIHALGGDPDEAQRILSLSPVRMAVELSKMAQKIEPQDDQRGSVSPSLPPPIRAVVGARGAVHEKIEPDDPTREDRLSVEEWMRRRSAQVADRRQGNRGLR